MKKNLFYLFALICTISLFTACSDDEKESRWAGNYGMTDYTVEADHMWGETPTVNWPISGAIYSDWKYTGKDNYPDFMAAVIRYIGGAILPQALKNVSLNGDGSISADYIAKPNIVFDPMQMMMLFGGEFPSASEVKANFATSGFVTSPKNLAFWSEKNGKILVKLDLAAILKETLGDESEAMANVINGILDSKPAELKQLLGGLLGVDLSKVKDATISQILGWVKNGVPMNIKDENGHTYIYLDKSAFDNLMTPHPGEVDEYDQPVCDLMIIWNALVAKGLIPAEAAAAAILLQQFPNFWPVTTEFALGLDVTKK